MLDRPNSTDAERTPLARRCHAFSGARLSFVFTYQFARIFRGGKFVFGDVPDLFQFCQIVGIISGYGLEQPETLR
jgi:hypothetical protein